MTLRYGQRYWNKGLLRSQGTMPCFIIPGVIKKIKKREIRNEKRVSEAALAKLRNVISSTLVSKCC